MSYEFQQELELSPIENYGKILITFEETGISPSILLKASFTLFPLRG